MKNTNLNLRVAVFCLRALLLGIYFIPYFMGINLSIVALTPFRVVLGFIIGVVVSSGLAFLQRTSDSPIRDNLFSPLVIIFLLSLFLSWMSCMQFYGNFLPRTLAIFIVAAITFFIGLYAKTSK